MKKVLIAVLLAGCGNDIRPDDTQPDAGAECPPPPDAADPVDAPPAPECPELEYGVIKCSELAPECSEPPVPPSQEAGLHCMPGYENNLRVPCFCVGANSTDSWCIRG